MNFFFRAVIYSDPTIHGQYTDVVFLNVEADTEHDARRKFISHYNSNGFYVRNIHLVNVAA